MLLMGKLTISMAIFNSYVSLPEGIVCGAPVRWLAKLVHITVPMMFITTIWPMLLWFMADIT